MVKSRKKTTERKVEILIAEDSPTQAAQLRHLLEENGYAVTAATNGREALALLERHTPTLVISDVVMPELDGYGLSKAIRASAKWREIPVVLVTTLSDPLDVIRGLECGADNFVRKPYDEAYLLSRLDYLLMNLELRKSQKMQIGVEINLGGQRHFITSERQQILDLLISTYEQAVILNNELKVREKNLANSNQVLNGLYRMAEGLNQADSEQKVAELALERALELPGVQAGWILLRQGETELRLAAARNLSPPLDVAYACCRRLLAGELKLAANFLECDCLREATGAARGVRHHGSVPLWLGDQTLGLMNLVGPDEGAFQEEELKVLHGIGNQVAVALERARLHRHLEKLVEARTADLQAEIVERKKAQRDLSESEERYRLLFDRNPYPIWVFDVNTLAFLAVNDAAIAHYGYSRQEFLSMTITEIRPAQEMPEVMRHIAEARNNPTSRSFGGFKHTKKDGTLIDVEIANSGITFAGRPARLVLAVDVTERRRLEAQHRAMEHRLEQEQRISGLGRVAATVAHEFNNVLMGIQPFAELIRAKAGDDERISNAVEQIFNSVRRGKRVTEQILRFTRPSDPQREVTEMGGWLTAIEPELRGVAGSSVQVTAVAPREPLFALCDASQMQQVVTNLVINARDAIHNGGEITVTLATSTGETNLLFGLPENARFVHLTVRDTGSGIPKEMLDRIFEPLFTTKRSGTGLGLAVARQVINQHGGSITAENVPDGGAAFHIFLPQVDDGFTPVAQPR
jgi:PAS domain S-box-containing protein